MERQVTEIMFSYYDKSPLQAGSSKQTTQKTRRKPEVVAGRSPRASTNKGVVDESEKLSQVDVDKRWTENVAREKMIAKDWQSNWSFLAGEYDSKAYTQGQPRLEGRQLGEDEDDDSADSTRFTVATTNRSIGASVTSPVGRRIQQLEFQFNTEHRRRGIDKELIGDLYA